MSTPLKPWEGSNLQNSAQVVRNANTGSLLPNTTSRNVPALPPRPSNSSLLSNGYTTNYMPHPGVGYGGYSSYGSSYGANCMPYRNPMYNSYGSPYGGYSYGMNGNGVYPNSTFSPDDHETRFIQYAEESSRNTFANVENIVRAFNNIAMMLDNTFFAMTSSFRAVLSVAENFGRLRTVFGHIWYSINIFRFFNWLYRRLMRLMGYKVPLSMNSAAWKEASHGVAPHSAGGSSGSSWPTIAFLGMIISAPYIISKFLPKYEDKGDPANWKSPGVRAKAAFSFIATAPNELTIQTNDIVTLAPTYIQEEMNLMKSGWAFAVCNGKSGVVPVNYLIISSHRPTMKVDVEEPLPVPRPTNNNNTKTHTKHVSFGENQIFDYQPPSQSSHVRKEKKTELKTNQPNEPDKVKDSEEKQET